MPFLNANPEIATRLIGVLCQRLRSTSEALEDALLRDAPSRVARGLLRLAATFGKQEPAGLRLDIKLSQQQLGNLIGISRESTNKYIVEWSRAGYLSVNSGFITISDLEALENLRGGASKRSRRGGTEPYRLRPSPWSFPAAI